MTTEARHALRRTPAKCESIDVPRSISYKRLVTFTPGSRLRHFQIVESIGAGGFGEVYKGVAIKVLPEHVSGRADLKERFEREARTISSLNHPYICVLHDIGHEDGVDFLVMEYLEGQTLAERLEKGALPMAEVLTHAIQIADALDKAHRQRKCQQS